MDKSSLPLSLGVRVEQGLAARLALLIRQTLLPALTTQLAGRPEAQQQILGEFQRAKALGVTADTEEQWRDRALVQIASAWALAPLFLRILVDQHWLDRRDDLLLHDQPGGLFDERAALGSDQDQRLSEVLGKVAALPAAAPIFGPENPLWRVPLGAEAAAALVQFFAATGLDGEALYRFLADESEEQVLPDLYESLSGDDRERLALIATPPFIARFLVKRTLEPALATFDAAQVRFLDPACGAGLLLTLALQQLVAAAPRSDKPGARVQGALARIGGLDLSPQAVLLSRFRLMLTALRLAEVRVLRAAPALPLRVALADALLPPEDQAPPFPMGAQVAAELLGGSYEAIACEPPFTTPKDTALRERYRRYLSARRQFSLVAPYTERCFQLAAPSGSVGLFVANSFMKREFGKALVEQVLAAVDLTLLVDSSAAFIPGHGTPTLLLFGQRRPPGSDAVPRACFLPLESARLRKEQSRRWPLLEQIANQVGFADDFLLVDAIDRSALAHHPWSLGQELPVQRLLQSLLAESITLQSVCTVGPRSIQTGAGDVFHFSSELATRHSLSPTRYCISGAALRDLAVPLNEVCFYPYDEQGGLRSLDEMPRARLFLEPLRPLLACRSKDSHEVAWYGFLSPGRPLPEGTIVGPRVTRYARFVPAPAGALALNSVLALRLDPALPQFRRDGILGYLNSSTAWLSIRHRASSFNDSYRLTSMDISSLPLPPWREENLAIWKSLAAATVHLLTCASVRLKCQPAEILRTSYDNGRALKRALSLAQHKEHHLFQEMVYAQEEIDWLVYQLLGFYREDPTFVPRRVLPHIRPFAWLSDKPPELLPQDLSERWTARRRALRAGGSENPLRILEQPENKRAFAAPPDPVSSTEQEGAETLARLLQAAQDYQQRTREACEDWLLDRLLHAIRESGGFTSSLAQLADRLATEVPVQAVLSAYPGFGKDNLVTLLRKVACAQAVPALAALRFTKAGLEKRKRLDEGDESLDLFDQGDYRDEQLYALRGRYDVPREVLLCFPGCGDKEMPLVLADWDPAREIAAIQALYQQLRESGTSEEASLQQLLQAIQERQSRIQPSPTP